MLLRTDIFNNMYCDIDERKCKSIYYKRKRSRKKISDKVPDLFKEKLSFALLISIFIILLSCSKRTNGQFPRLANAIWGKDSYLPGVKKIVGGLLAADITHSKCGQKMLCDEMAPAKVEMTDAIDPVKRTIVRIPRLVKPPGRLRWIGDAVFNTASRISRRMGFDPNDLGNSNRRQGVSSNFVVKGISGAMGMVKGIPVDMVMHAMDFLADATNVFDRKGAIYPYARAASIGYFKGGHTIRRGDDEYSGVCNQVSEDQCGMERVSDDEGHRWTGWWSHLPTANNYEAGSISRTNSNNELAKTSLNRAGLERDSALNNQWNFLNPGDLLKPRIFVCKAGRFLDTMSYQMGGEGSIKGREEGEHVSEKFEDSCDPAHLEEKTPPTDENAETDAEEEEVVESIEIAEVEGSDVVGGEQVDHTIAVLDARNGSNDAGFKLPPNGDFKLPNESGFHDLPILVLEGLQEPKIDQTEEDLVSEVLSDMVSGLPKNAVRTAIRLPLTQQTSGKTIVLVELDTEDHENLILKQRNALRGGSLDTRKSEKIKENNTATIQKNQNIAGRNDKFLLQRWRNLGMRRAKFKELWKFVEELAVVKRVTNIPSENKEEITNSNKVENNKFLFGTSEETENNKFLFGTGAETSLNVNDAEKQKNRVIEKYSVPPQVVVRKKNPLKIFENSGEQDSSSNDVK